MKEVHLDKLTEQDYNDTNFDIHNKVANGKPLTKEEKYFFCGNLNHDFILQHNFCHDEFYYRFFLDKDFGPGNLYSWHPIHRDFYNSLIQEWKHIIANEKHTDRLLKINSEETRKELKAFKKENRILNLNFNSAQYLNDIYKIYAWSKFRYLAIKRVVDLFYKNEEFQLSFNGEKVYLNYKSLTHIATRHFGKKIKPFETNKDFFSKVFLYDNLHTLFENIFNQIDKTEILNSGYIKELIITFHGDLYKMYFEKHVKQLKGIPDKVIIVITTFFLLSDTVMLKSLNENFKEIYINNKLSFFAPIKMI